MPNENSVSDDLRKMTELHAHCERLRSELRESEAEFQSLAAKLASPQTGNGQEETKVVTPSKKRVAVTKAKTRAQPKAKPPTRSKVQSRQTATTDEELTGPILRELEKAGDKGILLGDVAKNLGKKNKRIGRWFGGTGRKNERVERMGRGRYRIKSAATEAETTAAPA